MAGPTFATLLGPCKGGERDTKRQAQGARRILVAEICRRSLALDTGLILVSAQGPFENFRKIYCKVNMNGSS